MKHAGTITPDNEYEAWLREFDLRDLDAADGRSMWALKYRSRLQRLLRALAELPAGAKLLEVGASQANASLLAAEGGLRAIALDREVRALVYARRKHERGEFVVLVGEAERLPLGEATCDAVVAAEILEHVPEPAAVLAETRRVLKPGGLLLVTTPNAEFVHERLPAYDGGPGSKAPPTGGGDTAADAGGHLFAFKLPELVELVRQAGFLVTESGYEGSIAMSGRLGLNRVLPPRVTTGVSRALNRLPGARWWSYNCFVRARAG